MRHLPLIFPMFLIIFIIPPMGFAGLSTAIAADQAPNVPARPNILWITSEDNGPHIGAYGDSFADTPNLDRLAATGMIYLNAWSTAPVCAPARTAIISGLYPTSTGSEHMRSMTRLPAYMKMFPQLLREAGYYCTNNRKEDYNLQKPGKVWDESSINAHWRNRRPGQPFFAVFNHTITHESQVRRRPHTPLHDSATVRVPAYHPDVPEVRQDWAQYYDKLSVMDQRLGRDILKVADAGLLEDTIIFYYADHGPGMPRGKRWPYNSGLRVPLIVTIPEKFQHLVPPGYVAGGKTDRLVGFVDLGPTVLSLAGIEPPSYMQGHAFMGSHESPVQEYLFGFRSRMDERYDMVRSVRDKRYVYIRNYHPHQIYGQFVRYMFQTPTTRVWKALYDKGQLTPPRTYFWEAKPPEELYDLFADADEVNNLAGSPNHAGIKARLREALNAKIHEVRDVGFLPEGEIHKRSDGSTPYQMGHDNDAYPMDVIFDMAERASSLQVEEIPNLRRALKHQDSAVRYWGALGLLILGEQAATEARSDLLGALGDPSPYVRITAAQALAQFGGSRDLDLALSALIGAASIKENGVYVSMAALNAIDALDEKARNLSEALESLSENDDATDQRMQGYVPKLIEKTLADFKGETAKK